MNANLPAITADKGKAIAAAPSQYSADYSLSELSNISQAFEASRMFPDIQSKAQAFVKILAGKEMGIPPFSSMTGIHIIKGKATVGSNLMASLIKDSGRYDYKITEHTAKVCKIQFFEHGQPVGISEFSIDDAKAAGVTGNDTWRKYPKNMLFARAISNGMRWYCPNATSGQTVYTPEEMGADVDEEGNVLNNAPPAAKLEIKTEATPELEPESRPEPDNKAIDNKAIIDEFYTNARHDTTAGGLQVDDKWINKHVIAAAREEGVKSSKALLTCQEMKLFAVLDSAAHSITAEIEKHKQDKAAEGVEDVQAEPVDDNEKYNDLWQGQN